MYNFIFILFIKCILLKISKARAMGYLTITPVPGIGNSSQLFGWGNAN